MTRWLLPTLAALLVATAIHADTLTGRYVEARNTDVYTGPCFANSDMNLTGKNAVVGWKIDKGTYDGVALDGLGIVAAVSATDTLGLKQTGRGKAVLIVDSRSTSEQQDALVGFAQEQLGGCHGVKIVGVQRAAVELNLIACPEGGCAVLKAGDAVVKTRCIDHKIDKACGNEEAFYPPLIRERQGGPRRGYPECLHRQGPE